MEAALQPLRCRSHQLQAQQRAAADKGVAHWAHVERPGLKEHARSLKDTLAILTDEEKVLRQRVEALATRQLGSDPSVSTGFNVIRSRTDGAGQPLSLEELQAERQRLLQALTNLSDQIATAKAEITRQRRRDDQEIWETQLVALQDTKRVYRDEINLVEVELLGREHSERIHLERRQAEKSGAAQLQRLQDQVLQTRRKLNSAKYQYYYPRVKGFNINFGGGGIYGACRNIDISEIHGYATVRAEIGSPATASSPERPARLIIQLEGARGGSASQQQQRSQAGRGTGAATSAPGPAAAAATAPARAEVVDNGQQRSSSSQPATVAPVRPHSFTEPTQEATRDAAAVTARLQQTSMQPNGSAQHDIVHKPSRLQEATSSRSLYPSACSTSSMSGLAPRPAARLPSQTEQPAPLGRLSPHAAPPLPQLTGNKSGKSGNVAMRFLRSIGSKKDKYQGKERGQVQPQPGDDLEAGSKKNLRTLASKLLHRKSSRPHEGEGRGGLGRLEFGGNALGGTHSILNGSVDEDASVHFSESNVDDLSDIAAEDDAGLEAPEGSAAELLEGDGSLASEEEEQEEAGSSPRAGALPDAFLTQEALMSQHRTQQQPPPPQQQRHPVQPVDPSVSGSSGLDGWLPAGSQAAASKMDTSSLTDDASSMVSLGDLMSGDATEAGGGSFGKGCFVTGRVNAFELTGEKGTKCPNLSIGQADVKALVFCRFVFDYTSAAGWHKAEKALFDVQNLSYKLKGNNVPMPSTLVKHLLRIFIPDLIHRRLQALLPKELGSYLMRAQRGVDIGADVAVVGPALAVLDADLSFEVRGPAKSTKDAKKQQHMYAAAKEARSLLGLSLPQAQILGELFGGRLSLLDPPRAVSIASLISFLAQWDGQRHLYDQICRVWSTAYQVLAAGHPGAQGDFNFRLFMDGPVASLRRKPARARVIVRNLDVGLNVDAIVSMVHDYTQRMVEELFIKGPQANPQDNPEYHVEGLNEQLEVLHAWHAWMLRELSHFKSKFRGAAATLLGAGDQHGFSMGVENAHYEGPLRVRLPVNMQLDADGAFSFVVPLPGPSGNIGTFMDVFKSLVVPAHLRPPAAAVNWAEVTGDSEVTVDMQRRLSAAMAAIQGVLDELNVKIAEQGLEREDEDAAKALSQPRTMVGERLGRLIVSRLKVRVRLDERRIGEILQGIDSTSMGSRFVSTAGRLLGHLGDVVTLGFTPAAAAPAVGGGASPLQAPSQYLFQFESSDISRLRADVQSLGFFSLVSPGGMVRLAHAIYRAFLLAFKGVSVEEADALRGRFENWYAAMTREGLELSICVDAKAGLEGGHCLLRFFGTADDAALRTTSPCVLTQGMDLVTVGKAMRGDKPVPAQGRSPRQF